MSDLNLKPYDIVNSENIVEAHIIAFKHKRTGLVGSNSYKPKNKNLQISQNDKIQCQCCGKTSQQFIDTNFDIDSIGFLGAGYPLYFIFNKLCWTLLVALLIVTKYSKPIYLTIFPRKKERIINHSDFMAILMFFVFILITFIYGWYMSWNSIVIDQNDTSPQDYSILVRNLPVARSQQIDQKLKQFFQTYYTSNGKPLKVAAVSLCYNIDPLAQIQKRKKQQVQLLKNSKKTIIIKNLKQGTQIIKQQNNYHGVVGKQILKVERKDPQQICKQLYNRLDRLADQGFKDNIIMFTGQAIVSFQKQQMKESVENSDLAAYFYGQKLRMSKAQDPKNIFWYNLHLDNADYKIKNILSIVCCSCIFMVSLLLQILMTYIRLGIAGTKYQSRSFNYFCSILVNLMNIIIPSVFLRFFSRFQGHRTHSQQMLSFSKKCILLQMMNTLVVPLIVYNLFKTNQEATFIEKQYGVLSRNELFGFIMSVLPSKFITQQIKIFLYERGFFVKWFLSKSLTVKQLCDLHEHMQFDLEKKYCDLIKSILLVFAFGVSLPKIILYALVNMILSGYIHRYYLARHTTVKHSVSNILNQQLFALLYLGLSLFLISQPISAIKAILILISLSLYFLPIISKIKKMVNRQKQQIGKNFTFQQCLQHNIFQTNYEKQNPANSKTFNKKY